jgi:predicted transcriptional regulator
MLAAALPSPGSRAAHALAPKPAVFDRILQTDERRRRAMQLRVVGLTQGTSAAVLGVSQPMVSRDLAAFRSRAAAVTAADDEKRARAIDEAMALYDEIQVLALHEYQRPLNRENGGGRCSVGPRLRWLRVAARAKLAQGDLLLALGPLQRRRAPPREGWSANEIRARLARADVLADLDPGVF